MPYLLRVKSFDPQFRPFLITVARAFSCSSADQAEELLDEPNPFIVYAGSVGEAVSLKLEIQSGILPDFLTSSSLDFQEPRWRDACTWPPVPKDNQVCDIELEREIRYSLTLTSVKREFIKPVIAAIRLQIRLPLDVVARYVKHPPAMFKPWLLLPTAEAIKQRVETGFYPSPNDLPDLRKQDPDFWANPASWPRPTQGETCCSVELAEHPG